MLDYKLLQAFASVVQEGGFEKAAAVIHITQSAISQRVKQLEEQFGQILLLRTNPPVPTPAGKSVLKLYHQVKHLEEDLRLALEPDEKNQFISIPIGVNADTLDTWFYDAVEPFLKKEKVVLDLSVDDQENTHRFLRDGKVLGCISIRETAIQGCNISHIGDIFYRLLAAPSYIKKWFPEGVTFEALKKAPAICFTRRDELNVKLFNQIFKTTPKGMPIHYAPTSVMFINLLKNGIGYGVLPDQQSKELIDSGSIVDLFPGDAVCVRLFWHCWNLKSRLLQSLSKELINAELTP